MNIVKLESERSGLFLNAKKMKVMKVRKVEGPADDTHILVSNEPVENVSYFTYLGAIFTNNYDDTKEIEHRIAIAKSATIALTSIWKDRNISVQTKKRLLQSLVLSIAAYGSECWVLKKSDRKRLESFELWCYHRIFRISWTECLEGTLLLGKVPGSRGRGRPKTRLSDDLKEVLA